MMKRLLGFMLLLAVSGFVAHAADETPRFEPIKMDGEWYILDKVTGKITPIRDFHEPEVKAPVKADTASKKDPNSKELKEPKIVKPATPKPTLDMVIEDDDKEIVIKPAKIKDPVKPVEVEKPVAPQAAGITDEMRKKSFVDVSGYRSNLSWIHTVQIQGGKLKATIAVTNKGNKKIDMLEVTLYVPTGDGLQFDEHHVLLGYKPGMKPPPAPNPEDPDNAEAQIVTVDYPAPPGGGKAKVDVKFTYIKFTEE